MTRQFLTVTQRTRNPHEAYIDKVLGIAPSNLIAFWPLDEVGGTNANNLANEEDADRDGTYTGVTLDSTTGPFNYGRFGLWDGSSDYCNIYSTELNSVFNGAEGAISLWAKVSGAGVWTDSTVRDLLILRVDATNLIRFHRTSVNNQIKWIQQSGGTSKSITDTSLNGTTEWFNLAVTWSESVDESKFYINGVQSGATQSSLGTWVGNLASTRCNIGATNTTPTLVFSGYLGYAAVYNTPLTAAQILELYNK